MNIKNKILIYLLLISSNATCQNISIECEGIETIIALGMEDKTKKKKEIYHFKNGLLYGNLSTNWFENSIIVEIPSIEINGTIFSRYITFDRILGTVFDHTKASIKNQQDIFFNFDGSCNKSLNLKKF